jgi:hypothetical protein
MNRSLSVHIMRIVVPLIAGTLIIVDCLLEFCVGNEATYTSIIRNWIYAWPSLTLFLTLSIGAVWAHLCWTPGAEVESIRRELRHMGAREITERSYLGSGNDYKQTFQVLVEGANPFVNIHSDWHPRAVRAWRQTLDVARRRAQANHRTLP